MSYIVMAYVVMTYMVMAYIVMTYMVMAYIVMTYIVMAFSSCDPRLGAPNGETGPDGLGRRLPRG